MGDGVLTVGLEGGEEMDIPKLDKLDKQKHEWLDVEGLAEGRNQDNSQSDFSAYLYHLPAEHLGKWRYRSPKE